MTIMGSCNPVSKELSENQAKLRPPREVGICQKFECTYLKSPIFTCPYCSYFSFTFVVEGGC